MSYLRRVIRTLTTSRGAAPLVLGFVLLSPPRVAGQELSSGRISWPSEALQGDQSLAELAWARAEAALYENNVEGLASSLETIREDLDERVDSPLHERTLRLPAGIESAEDRLRFVLSAVMPYLYPATAGQEYSCTSATTLTFYVGDGTLAGGIERSQRGHSCTAGSTKFSMTTMTVRGGGREAGLSAVSLRLGAPGLSIRFGDDSTVIVGPAEESGPTLMATAAALGRPQLMEALRGAGAAIEAHSRNGRTVLHVAAEEGAVASASWLLKAGADPNVTTETGLTPLHLASSSGDAGIVALLLTGGADARATAANGTTPLMLAARASGDVVGRLLEAGAEPERSDLEGRTALHHAAGDSSAADAQVVAELVGAGAVVDRRTTAGDTPLHVALESGRMEMAEALLDAGADVNAPGSRGLTALAFAARSQPELVGRLLARGAEPGRSDEDGWTPLHHAASRGSISAAREIIRHGAAVNAPTPQGVTALMMSAEAGATTLSQLLLDSGARVDEQDAEGNTALLHAASAGKTRAAEALIRRGAKRGVRNRAGQTAESAASANGHGRIAAMFRHSKWLHFIPLKFGGTLARLGDAEDVSGGGWEAGVSVAVRLHERVRLQADVALVARSAELGESVILPLHSDLVHWLNTTEIRPRVRYALSSPYRTHAYLLAGVGVGSLSTTPTPASGFGVPASPVAGETESGLRSASAGLGVQWVSGRRVLTAELMYTRVPPLDPERFDAPVSAFGFSFGIGW